MMDYKGHIGKVEFDDEAAIFLGEISNTRGVITFQGKSVAGLTKAFRVSIDEYLTFCKQRGEDPDKPFSGKVAIPPGKARQEDARASDELVPVRCVN
jgi:predicted HicB family RNase H-like nuclease